MCTPKANTVLSTTLSSTPKFRNSLISDRDNYEDLQNGLNVSPSKIKTNNKKGKSKVRIKSSDSLFEKEKYLFKPGLGPILIKKEKNITNTTNNLNNCKQTSVTAEIPSLKSPPKKIGCVNYPPGISSPARKLRSSSVNHQTNTSPLKTKINRNLSINMPVYSSDSLNKKIDSSSHLFSPSKKMTKENIPNFTHISFRDNVSPRRNQIYSDLSSPKITKKQVRFDDDVTTPTRMSPTRIQLSTPPTPIPHTYVPPLNNLTILDNENDYSNENPNDIYEITNDSSVDDSTNDNSLENEINRLIEEPVKRYSVKERIKKNTPSSPLCLLVSLSSKVIKKTVENGPLEGIVAYVDVNSSKVCDASEIIIEKLLDLGAIIIKDLSSKQLNNYITHVIFRHGDESTLLFAKNSLTELYTVTPYWAIHCYIQQEYLSEEQFIIDIDKRLNKKCR